MRIMALIIGVLAILLGGLWLVQGLGLVHIKPVACVAECQELKGPSTTWAIAGAVTILVGVLLARWSRRPRA